MGRVEKATAPVPAPNLDPAPSGMRNRHNPFLNLGPPVRRIDISADSTLGKNMDKAFFSPPQVGKEEKEETPDQALVTRFPDGIRIELSHLGPLLGLDQAEEVVDDKKGKGRENLMTDMERKLFVIQFKAYRNKNEKIKTIRQYVSYILKHKEDFVNKTVQRAISF